jgi:hypothetical protein
MTNKQDVISRLTTLNSKAIDDFVVIFGEDIRQIILDNGGNESQFRENLLNTISEVIFRIKSAISFNDYELGVLINTISYLFFKKDRKDKKKQVIYGVKHYDFRTVKLHSHEIISKDEQCESILKGIGEPGRTILKLSLFESSTDEEITDHVQFESVELLKLRRLRMIESCSINML